MGLRYALFFFNKNCRDATTNKEKKKNLSVKKTAQRKKNQLKQSQQIQCNPRHVLLSTSRKKKKKNKGTSRDLYRFLIDDSNFSMYMFPERFTLLHSTSKDKLQNGVLPFPLDMISLRGARRAAPPLHIATFHRQKKDFNKKEFFSFCIYS